MGGQETANIPRQKLPSSKKTKNGGKSVLMRILDYLV